jgi:hypothetical protein
MKKLTFHRWLRLVPTLTSAQRHDLEAALEKQDKKDLVAEVAALVGFPPVALIAIIPASGRGAVRPGSRAIGAKGANEPLVR